MSGPAAPAIRGGKSSVYLKLMLFFFLVGLLGLLQLWLQWGMASFVSNPPMRLPEIVSDGSVFFYSLGLYFATLYAVMTFHDYNAIKPVLIASLLIGVVLLFAIGVVEGIDLFEYFTKTPHTYRFPTDLFAWLQAVCALISLSYATVCTFKLEAALAVGPAAPSQPIMQTI
jgi:hypothetical protein